MGIYSYVYTCIFLIKYENLKYNNRERERYIERERERERDRERERER